MLHRSPYRISQGWLLQGLLWRLRCSCSLRTGLCIQPQTVMCPEDRNIFLDTYKNSVTCTSHSWTAEIGTCSSYWHFLNFFQSFAARARACSHARIELAELFWNLVNCVQVNEEFLAYTAAQGNDLSSVVKAGQKWCLCASR